MAQRRAGRVSQSPEDDDLDAFMQSRQAAASPSSDLQTTIPLDPTGSLTPLTEAASKVGRPMIRLQPPAADLTQVPRNVFTGGAQEPGMATEEEKARWRASLSDEHRQQLEEFEARQAAEGSPRYESVVATQGVKRLARNIRDIAGDVSGYGPSADPSQSLTDVTGFVPPEKQREHPYQTGITQAVTGLGSPENVALIAATAGLGELPALARAGISAYFAAQMAKGAYDQIPGIEEARRRGDWSEVKRLATLAGVNVLMGAATGAHGIREAGLAPEVKTSPFVEKGTISEPLAADNAVGMGERFARINARVPPKNQFESPAAILPQRPEGPEPNPLSTEAAKVREQQGNQRADEQAKNPPAFTVKDSRRVRPAGPQELPGQIGPKHEPLAPESPATLKAQVDALKKGTNSVVYFPKGTENIPAPPENSQVTVVPGDHAGSGTYYHTADVTPEQIKSSVADGSFGKLLGYQQSKEEALGGKAPAAITARDARGAEIKGALADVANPHVVAAQAAELARQFPNAKISIEPPENIVRERLGVGTKQSVSAPQTPVSRETPATETQTRIASTVPEDLRPVIEHNAMDFFMLSRRVRRFDPDFAEGMDAIADGRLHTPDALRKFVDETIRDSKAKADLTKLVADYAAHSEPSTGVSATSKARGIPRTAPKSARAPKFSPEALEEARQEIRAASGLASSFERPGRYFAGIGQDEQGIPQRSQSSAKGIQAGGTWYGVSSSKHMVADQYPWFAKMKGAGGKLAELVGKEKGAEYERLVATVAEHIQREKETAAPVIAEFAPKLKSLSDEIDGNDVELSELLAQVAVADGRGFKNLRQYLGEKVSNAEQARDFFKSVNEAAAEARSAGAEEPVDQARELRQSESSRTAESSEAAPGEASSSASEFLPAHQLRQRAPAEKQNALPGFESAIDEQRASAERVRGEELTDEANRPLGDITRTAGEMERNSPLFRGTAASPQNEMFGEAPKVAVGDRIRVNAGPLKGQNAEITAVGVSGVHVRMPEGGPVKFVNNGDFKLSSEFTSGNTLFANPIGAALSEGSRLFSRVWEQKVARPFIDRVLKIGDKYRKAREADPAVAEGLHLLDNAPQYLRAKAAQQVQNVIGGLSRVQERLFTLMADADSRENLRTNHPREYRQAQNDQAIQEALRKYKPLEQELTALREKMGGQTLEQDYLRRVYDKYVAGVNKPEAEGKLAESAPSQFDRVIRPQTVNPKSREATAEYHYQNGLHEFGPAFATKFVATHLKALRDEVAQEFLSKATMEPTGGVDPRSITYGDARYYRPDVAREMREAGAKGAKEYGWYDPTQGEKFPTPSEGRYLGPKEITNALTDYGRKEAGEPGSIRRFFQEQILGFGFGVPHIFNILRRVTQQTEGGAANPVAWARAMKVAFGRELRSRGIEGLNDPTFDTLAKHGAISTGEVANLKKYIGGNLNPANWMRSFAQIGHKALFEPGSFGGLGGIDQRARIYVADLMRSQRPGLSDTEVSRAVNDALGEYNRANWTDRQKLLGRFLMFPGWDFASLRWVLQHPIRTTVPPALVVMLANRALHSLGQNREEDQNDIAAIHVGDRAYSTGLLRESMARNLFRPALNYAQSKIRGENNQRAFDEAARGMTSGAGGLLSTLRPDLSGFVALATNRESLFSGKEIVSKQDYDTPGKILPSKALEKQAVFTVRHALPALDRMLDSNQDVDLRSFVGGNLGVPNYKDDAEKRLIRNDAEAARVGQTVSKLAKTSPGRARTFLRDPDNATYALFRRDLAEMTKNLHAVDEQKQFVEDSNLPDAQKQSRLQALDKVRANVLAHADALNNLLFRRRMGRRAGIPMAPPVTSMSAPAN